MAIKSGNVERRDRIRMFSPYVTEEAIARVAETLRSGYIGDGPVVKEFEGAIKEMFGIPYPVAVNSCTSALQLALYLIGLEPGDEVITTAQTFMATSHVILAAGAKPVYADVQYLTGNMDPADIEHRITERTQAIMPVHWAGYPCDMDEILEIAARYELPVIEDAAQALGASYKGRPIGTISSYTSFSFQAVKQIIAGDGGMLCLADEATYEEARRRRWFGIDRDRRKPTLLGEAEWDVTEIGYKYHMNDIAASLGVEHLKVFSEIARRRAEIDRRYREALAGVPGITLFESKDDRISANWIFCMHVDERRVDFVRMMKSKGVDVSVVHLRIDRNTIFGPVRDDLPQLARLTETIMSLPLHNHLSDEDVEYVIQCVKEGW